MKKILLLSCVLGLFGTQAALATTVNADYVVVTNPTAAIFGDLFDAPALGSPPWFPTGAPGPQAGGFLEMHGGDAIAAGLSVNPQDTVTALTAIDLTSFGAGSSLALTLGAGRGSVSLVVTPTFSFVGNGGILGAVALDPGTSAFMTLGVDPLGNIAAAVNGTTIYDGPGAGPLTVDAITLQVVPEPTTLLAGFAIAGLMSLRRSRRCA